MDAASRVTNNELGKSTKGKLAKSESEEEVDDESEEESNSNSASECSSDEQAEEVESDVEVVQPKQMWKMIDEDKVISSCDEDDELLSSADETSSEESPSQESEDNVSEEEVPVKVKKYVRKEKLYLNLAYTHYPVIKKVGKDFNFKITRNDDADWDLIWLDGALPPEKMLRMKSHQKANHYPGMYALSRKNHLGRNLMKMFKLFPLEYRFFPKTWLLPYEMVDFKNNFNKRGKSRKAFIVKPEASCQGEGIFITKTLKKIDADDH